MLNEQKALGQGAQAKALWPYASRAFEIPALLSLLETENSIVEGPSVTVALTEEQPPERRWAWRGERVTIHHVVKVALLLKMVLPATSKLRVVSGTQITSG